MFSRSIFIFKILNIAIYLHAFKPEDEDHKWYVLSRLLFKNWDGG